MLTEEAAKKLAYEWVEAWNSHDLERIMEHYEDDVTLTSPVVAERFAVRSGTLSGKTSLYTYFRLALQMFPELHFELVDVMWGISSVVLYYVNQRGTMTGEVMEIAPSGRVARVLANYSNGPRPER